MDHEVVGLDNLNDYYDIKLKEDRLAILQKQDAFSFYRVNLENSDAVAGIFADESFDYVVNLAAQAGVRYSIENPMAYVQSNLVGQVVMLEQCRRHESFEHLVYASSSSVYGGNTKLPFSGKRKPHWKC